MNRYLASFLAYYSTMREPVTLTFDYEDWEQRFRNTEAEYRASFTALLANAYPLAATAISFGRNS